MKNYLFIFTLLFFININLQAQNNNTQTAFYNIGLGGVMSSIGAAINKKPNEKLGKVMLKGFLQGALGGTVVYGSKQMVYHFNKKNKLENLWMSKLVNSAGISIIENASLNNNFYDKWHLNIGFNRIELDTKNKLKLSYKLMPTALIGTFIAANNNKFNFKYTVQTLTPIFISKNTDRPTTSVNSIHLKQSDVRRSMAHEFIHTLQYDDFMSVNVFFNKQKIKWTNKYSFVHSQSKWLYIDLPGGITLRSFYILENNNQKCYYDNFFENEANFYSNKKLCP